MSTAGLELKTVSIVGECGVGDDTPEVMDAKSVADALSDKPYGYGFNIAITEDKKTKFYAAVRVAAIRNGFSVTSRRSENGFRIFKQEPKETNADAGVMQELRGNGLTLQAIADRFGITRERVRQQTVGVKKFSSLPSAIRTEEFLKFAEPFIAAVQDHPSCLVCLRPQKTRRDGGICQQCRDLVKMLTQTASRIRSFKKSGQNVILANAIQNIRKYNLQPQDLELM